MARLAKQYALSHLSNGALIHDLKALVARDRTTTAELLAHLAEVQRRKLYAPAGYPSLYAYCVGELRLSEDSALKRIRAAKAARKFPVILDAIADGRLNLSGVVLLKKYLQVETADELLTAAAHKTNAEIQLLIARRFPQSDLPSRVESVVEPMSLPSNEQALEATVDVELAVRPVETPTPHPKVAPIAPERFALQLTMGREMHDRLRRAQALLSHQIPSGDVVEVLDRALEALIDKLEKRKFGNTDKPRPARGASSGRCISAHVRRAVRERDGDQCTFVSDSGRRCSATKFLEFDHVQEFARGGEATVENLRLRCHAHNQYAAEQTYGAGFMDDKREEARRAADEARVSRAAEKVRMAEDARSATERAREQDVVPWLRSLGFRPDEARHAAKLCEDIPDAPMEERVRVALSYFKLRGTKKIPAPNMAGRVEVQKYWAGGDTVGVVRPTGIEPVTFSSGG